MTRGSSKWQHDIGKIMVVIVTNAVLMKPNVHV